MPIKYWEIRTSMSKRHLYLPFRQLSRPYRTYTTDNLTEWVDFENQPHCLLSHNASLQYNFSHSALRSMSEPCLHPAQMLLPTLTHRPSSWLKPLISRFSTRKIQDRQSVGGVRTTTTTTWFQQHPNANSDVFRSLQTEKRNQGDHRSVKIRNDGMAMCFGHTYTTCQCRYSPNFLFLFLL